MFFFYLMLYGPSACTYLCYCSYHKSRSKFQNKNSRTKYVENFHHINPFLFNNFSWTFFILEKLSDPLLLHFVIKYREKMNKFSLKSGFFYILLSFVLISIYGHWLVFLCFYFWKNQRNEEYIFVETFFTESSKGDWKWILISTWLVRLLSYEMYLIVSPLLKEVAVYFCICYFIFLLWFIRFVILSWKDCSSAHTGFILANTFSAIKQHTFLRAV